MICVLAVVPPIVAGVSVAVVVTVVELLVLVEMPSLTAIVNVVLTVWLGELDDRLV